MKLPSFLQKPIPWGLLFIAWFIALWFLSSRPLTGPPVPPIPYFDKVLHFGYFFGGAGLLSAVLFLQQRAALHWSTLHLLVVLVIFLTGSLDEWHQSWYPFRSGNDSGDLTADLSGGFVGSLVFRKLQPLFFPKN